MLLVFNCQSWNWWDVEYLLESLVVVVVVGCMRFNSAVLIAIMSHLLLGERHKRGESWQVWHMAAFCFLLDFPQCSDWQVFKVCIAASVKKHKYSHAPTQKTNPVNCHLHFELHCSSLWPTTAQSNNTTKHFPPVLALSLSLLPCLSHPFNFISCNVINACFAQSRCHFS